MKRLLRKRDENVDFWQSAVDLLLALLLVLLLILSLLLLYLKQVPENDFRGWWGGGASDNGVYQGDYYQETTTQSDFNGYDGRGAGWGGGAGVYQSESYHDRYPLPTSTTGLGDEWGKSAVYVNVIDAETLRAIRKEGITFELYEQYGGSENMNIENRSQLRGGIRYLNTYYPEKITYKTFDTTEYGNFYLPEKIEQGWYYFKEITEPEGYDGTDVVFFNVDNVYDWPDPYVVSVALYPSRNYIRVKLTDSETGEAITSGSFKVTASEDIVTSDGTVRYVKNEEVTTFLNGSKEDGTGHSEELYLGKYNISSSETPRYYASIDDSMEITVAKKNGLEPEVQSLVCEKTAINVYLTDDVTGAGLDGAVFSLISDSGEARTETTDGSGHINFTNLDKNVTYTVAEQTAPAEYKKSDESFTFRVDEGGRIEGAAKARLNITNFIPRVSISMDDMILRGPATGLNLTLYNSAGQAVRSWTSGATSENINNLPAGDYYILINEKAGSRRNFTIADDQAINEVNFSVVTMQSVLTVAAAIFAGLLILFFVITLLSRILKKGNKRSAKNDQ
ncbi:MAG: prealbumin-like fold domain-containing protein [Eubacteriales bacterium]|nr:prealbumin-like fold domain-containing protein [Eubacteriales bacterium]